MEKELFIKSILAIKEQVEHDIKVAKKLSEAFPNAFCANLMPDNHYLQDALMENLKSAMNDQDSFIDYFCWELCFGSENYRLNVYDKNNKVIPLSTPEELWDFLSKKK
jgi:hypothetical protein